MILMYHKVCPDSPTMWWVEVDSFYRQLCELKCRQVVYLDDYDPADPNQVVITFDGIYKNVLQFAAPLLKDFGYPFELFVTSDYIGRDNSFDTPEPPADFASIEELQELMQCGGRLQWHTCSHLNLKDITDPTIIATELAVPPELQALDATGFKWFAYPHGEFNDTVLKQARLQFAGAVSCHQGDGADPYQLNRITVVNETSFKKGTITVIVASYNYGSFLIEALESVLRQTRPADEILIADDCSTDNTREIAQYYVERYPELIRYISNEHNMGIVGNFNKAVSLATSDYICFLGADNRFRSDYLKRTAEILDHEDTTGIAYTDFALFGQRAKLVYATFLEENRGPVKENSYYIINFPDFPEDGQELLERGNFIHGSSLYRKQAFTEAGGYQERTDMPEDYSLFLRMVKKGWRAKRVPHPVLEYRQHSKDQTNIRLTTYVELNYYKSQVKIKEERAAKLSVTIEELQRQVVGMEELQRQLVGMEELQRQVVEMEELQRQLVEMKERQHQITEIELSELRHHIGHLENRVSSLTASISWKITSPLRWLGSLLK